VMLDLAGAQVRLGLQARVLNFGADDDFLVQEARSLGVDVFSVGDPSLRSWQRSRKLLSVVGGRRADVIQVHTPHGMRSLAPYLPLLGARIVYTRHGVGKLQAPHWDRMHRWIRPFVDVVTFVTPEGPAAAAGWHRGWKQPSVVIENGVDTDVETTRSPAPDGRLRLGSVGRLVALKGHSFLFESLARLPGELRSRVSVEIFGDGPDRRPLAASAAEALPDVPVRFHGAVMERSRIYGEIDILVVSSRSEGMSMAIMEAMARRIPVIATSVGGNPVLVRHEETGLLVPYGEAEPMAAAITRLTSDQALAGRLAEGGREFISREYSLERMARRYVELYALESSG